MAKLPLPAWIGELLPEAPRLALARAVRGEGAPVLACSLSRTARSVGLAVAAREAVAPLLVVVPSDSVARALVSELADLLGDEPEVPVLRLPPLDADPYRGMPAHPAVAAQRVATLDRIARGEGALAIVAPVDALLVPVPRLESIRRWARKLAPGVRVDLDQLAREAVAGGYRVVDVVTSPGDLARRGGLFDIWPPQEDAPLRVELFGDEVETVRAFDAGTQRTTGRVQQFLMLPAREAPIGPEQADALLDRLIGRARDVLAEAPLDEDNLPVLVQELLAGLEGAPALYRDDLTALDALVPFRVVAVEPDELEQKLEARWNELETSHVEAEGDRLPAPRDLYVPPERVRALLEKAPLAIGDLPLASGPRQVVDLEARPPRGYSGRIEELPVDLQAACTAGRPVVLLSRTTGRRDRLQEILGESRVPFRIAGDDEPWAPAPGEVVLARGALDQGVEFGPSGALLLVEADLFGPEPAPPPPRKRRGGEAFLTDLRDLKEGDLVVHVDHGIGRYVGLARRPVTGEELLQLEYAAGDRLYVPVSRLDLIQKYSGGEQSIVPLDRLGGPGWERRQQKARKAVAEMAGELLELYAKRRNVRTHAFGADSNWQREFEDAFPHELTHDQAAGLAEIKRDLAQTTPMDRLLCGDVGYGKTEVALRAAFKVVQEGWQVAVLVPTTVLAFQHLATFRARMASWPVRVEMISRLVPAADVKKSLEAVAKGDVDILIGTHRLLSKDVQFRRLGLLCIDEEQRFGVRHKETIKKLSLGVHTLAMTATPIPRTLQMSMAGVRELSVIETPPRNRHAIQTHLSPWSPSLAAAAVRNELKRGGQVFYITPRVQGIENVVARLAELVPEATIRYAHGQMAEGQLERVMLEFMRGEAQVLVATTIIENGLDIPRANTILVTQAHRFGLAQLYQMRGRVGRSDQRAYAYLFVPSRREMTPEARRRLAALAEFSELGSGFRIAALDLEIRGAGELLGARQSGHIAAIGFDLYVQMLERAVRQLQGLPLPEPPEPVSINLGLPAHLPEDYVPHAGQRLEIYKRLSAAERPDEVRNVMEETQDRFGRLPEPARNLFRVAELRILAAEHGAVAVDWAEDGIAVRFGGKPRIDTERIVELLQRDPEVRLSPSGVIRLRVGDPRADRIAAASLALRRLAS
ncbi:MAG: transcription-repair coupling factor [Acidobacteria bacterium]|nr:transcription-repair coupling factor [Acidobacteriota bacterium]